TPFCPIFTAAWRGRQRATHWLETEWSYSVTLASASHATIPGGATAKRLIVETHISTENT
ncbi:MAG: hypothetical protein KJZ93_17180, partial [Caldilineaceae bacterium]|nr:hypothetical protein [Caldilineaceae bacterium]